MKTDDLMETQHIIRRDRSFHLRMHFVWFLIGTLAGFLSLSACVTRTPQASPAPALVETPQAATLSSPAPAPAQTLPQPTVVIQPSATEENLPAAQSSAVGRTHYHILASLDYQAHMLSVEEHVTYLNTTGVALDSLVWILEPQRLSPQFSLRELHWQDGSLVDPYTLQEGVLLIPLPNALAPGDSLSLVMAFAYAIPEGLTPLSYSSRQTNLADWYAFVPAYHTDGWMVRLPAQVGEHLVYDLADYRVEFRLIGLETDLVLAAPVTAEVEGALHRFSREQARNFSLSVSPDYVLLQDRAARINAYVFPEHTAAGQTALRCVGEAMQYFSEEFGEPGLESMNLVEADFPDGMEYDGLFFLNHLYFEYPGAGVQGGLCTLSVHETAHQWWYRLVGNDPALQPWLDEALCTFSELIFYEARYPEMVNWWWGYRINDYNPQGWVNSTIYDHSDYRAYVNAVYLRGVRLLDALRRSIGDQAMLDFLRMYVQAYRYKLADTQGFFQIFSETSQQEIEPVLEQYFK